LNKQANLTSGYRAATYGRELLFGTLITPVAQPPMYTVEPVVVAETNSYKAATTWWSQKDNSNPKRKI
jgi:hypothetical protein